MKIRIGYELVFDCPKPTPMILTLKVHSTRVTDLIFSDPIVADPLVTVDTFFDSYGNQSARIVAPKGILRLSTDAVINDSGLPDAVNPQARQTPVEQLPDDTLQFLLGSRYCETDLLGDTAWQLFSNNVTGWSRAQAICDYVHHHIAFGYHDARNTRTAWEVFQEKKGVCRDFAHLAIAFCRCMNIPARYCTGYLGDMGIPPPYGEMDFAAWFEVYLDGKWYIFDPRNNMPRIGRILIARGRDAADVAISTAFGPNTLKSFKVHTDESDESCSSSTTRISIS
ncbi:transglutaminase-like putative cysteine protease [Methylohalomonas lacus]|uniref:Transglutaminase-like putative cysteine protease n=1 Tax=Methylohalomonas lacus TaxID=398773 RepID=A0AAE3HI78_9GAMM|nr:transglutaminase family protein [Methylohalomonas lacus]MCS3902826.1 transglutaminase-like putative cysteine protease [Methylohalomonas lacus]